VGRFLFKTLLSGFLGIFLLPQLVGQSSAATSPYEQLLGQGNGELKAGKLDEAMADAKQAIAADGTRFEAYTLAAMIAHKEGNDADAKAFLDKAQAMVPADKKAKLDVLAQVILGSTPPSPAVGLSPDVRLRLNALLLVFEDADKATLADDRRRFLADFLSQSAPFVKDNPGQLRIWVLRAVASLELNQSIEGHEAAHSLMGLGAEKSDDPKIQKIMAMLERNGWFAELPKADSSQNRTLTLAGSQTVTLVWIPAGTFTMGSPLDEPGRKSDEVQHQVTITKPFWLGQTGVTQAQYEAVMGTNPSHFKGSNLPVETVSWEDAMAFCKKLTDQELAGGRLLVGYHYTLPTDAQREFACRAGTTGAYAGDLDSIGWYNGNSAFQAHSVGQKQPNAWGLYDMHGNVWEWCLDWYGAYPNGSVTDPAGPTSGTNRNVPGLRNNDLGFRLALSSVP
jgi:formylglycine-generating enzyme required for sulfatase activity